MPDLYKGMSRTFFSLRRRRGFWFARSSPSHHRRRSSGVVPLGYSISVVASSLVATTPISFETNQAVRLYGVNHGSIGGSWPSAFSGYPRGHRDYTETGCHRHRVVYRRLSYSPSNPSVSRTDWPPTEKITGDGRALHQRRSSGLRFQFFCVEGFSLLPKSQRDGCNLACQRETRHGRLDAFRQRGLGE